MTKEIVEAYFLLLLYIKRDGDVVHPDFFSGRPDYFDMTIKNSFKDQQFLLEPSQRKTNTMRMLSMLLTVPSRGDFWILDSVWHID